MSLIDTYSRHLLGIVPNAEATSPWEGSRGGGWGGMGWGREGKGGGGGKGKA